MSLFYLATFLYCYFMKLNLPSETNGGNAAEKE